MIFRASEDGLLWGYNIEADAFIIFSGSVGGSSIGVAVEASLTAKFVARLIAFLSWRLSGTLIYGLISLDANLRFSVRAWMDIDLGIKTITISISFSFSVQFSAAVELAISTDGVGGRVAARVAVSAFGCTLSVHINFSVSPSKLDAARARVQRFLALGITNENTPDTARYIASTKGDDEVSHSAQQAQTAAPQPPLPPSKKDNPGNKPSTNRAQFGDEIKPTDFWLILHAAGPEKPSGYAYAVLVPKEAGDKSHGSFYSSAQSGRPRTEPTAMMAHKLRPAATGMAALVDVERWDGDQFRPFNGRRMPALSGRTRDPLRHEVNSPDTRLRVRRMLPLRRRLERQHSRTTSNWKGAGCLVSMSGTRRTSKSAAKRRWQSAAILCSAIMRRRSRTIRSSTASMRRARPC